MHVKGEKNDGEFRTALDGLISFTNDSGNKRCCEDLGLQSLNTLFVLPWSS